MLNFLLIPITGLMQRLRLLPKFMLLLAVFAIPLGLTTTLLMNELGKSIAQAQQERVGIQHLQSLQGVIEQAQLLRATRHMSVMGNGNALGRAKDLQAALGAQLDAFEQLQQAEPALYAKPEWEKLRSSWQSLQGKLTQTDRKHYGDYTDFIRQLHALQGVIADRAHLSNDPEVSTYYLAMLVTKEMPRIAEGIMEMAGRGAAYIDSGLLEANEEGLLGSIALVTGRDLGAWREQIEALKKNGVDESALTAAMQANDQASAFLQRASNEVLSSVDQTSGDQFLQAGSLSVQAINAASTDLSATLDQLLAKRIAHDTRDASVIVLVIACVLLIAACFLLGFYRSFSQDMQRLHTVIQQVAQGDLAQSATTKGKDELAQLLIACSRMRVGLTDMVRRVRRGSDTIAVASQEIASGNLDLSTRTEEQASSLEQTASAMTELTQTVRQNAVRAQQASQRAQVASHIAGQGGELVEQAVTTMSVIRQSSRQISEIVGVVDSIAFQTNILALNAAVEAARAGQQGKGFAVVASEVRNLAQRSAVAAREIKELIETSEANVASGSKQVDQAGQTMAEIVRSIRDVTSFMEEIADASEEQQRGIEHISQALLQMDDITQQNAALVEQAAAAAESMREQALTLSQAVAVFKLDEAKDTSVLSDRHASQDSKLVALADKRKTGAREAGHTRALTGVTGRAVLREAKRTKEKKPLAVANG
ncbi:MAG: methyl-accepting chemotaxis protein [Oxalicibacterium faecigallinarum]|uniref:methyl-accepting chemotaxis protein n=1 Tax=Oxalicibacterium faecigallinarum TaxID=573741 RepID=UPI0028069CEA|nr:methyl-accepting chemotaxis protein [Oxalicibacterium faecigallinarum]MDQ7970371.1 methyl-accepting chemotaxis protein [Oxalicibacterium faecigallinarum]